MACTRMTTTNKKTISSPEASAYIHMLMKEMAESSMLHC